MRITRRALGMVVTGAAVAAVTACSRGPLKVERLQLGRALNSDKSIATHATRFKPDQTVYVSILTMGAGSIGAVAHEFLVPVPLQALRAPQLEELLRRKPLTDCCSCVAPRGK